MEDLSGYISFMKDMIKQSLTKNERENLTKGLKLIGISLEKLLSSTIRDYEKNSHVDDSISDQIPEFEISAMPQVYLFKKMEAKFKDITVEQEKILEDFSKTQLALSFITFDYYKIRVSKAGAVTYAKWMLNAFEKLRIRIGEELPQYILHYEINMQKQIDNLEKELNADNNEITSNNSTIHVHGNVIGSTIQSLSNSSANISEIVTKEPTKKIRKVVISIFLGVVASLIAWWITTKIISKQDKISTQHHSDTIMVKK